MRYEETYRPLTEEELKAMQKLRNSLSGYIPLVDPATITDSIRFNRDLGECATLATYYGPEDRVASGAAGSAMVGAGVGALLSHILGASPGRGEHCREPAGLRNHLRELYARPWLDRVALREV